MNPTSVLFFAAGLGTRMAPLTNTIPKPLIPVAGRPLIDHARAQCAGFHQVVNVHYRAEQLRAHLAGSGVLVSDETDLLRDTGGGLKHALPLLGDGAVVTMNTDAVWTTQTAMDLLMRSWEPTRMEGLLLLVKRDAAIGHHGTSGFDMDTQGRLTPGPGYVFTGVQIIMTDGLSNIREDVFSMWALWRGMLERRTLFGTVFDGRWCDVGQPESIALAEQMLKDHVRV